MRSWRRIRREQGGPARDLSAALQGACPAVDAFRLLPYNPSCENSWGSSQLQHGRTQPTPAQRTAAVLLANEARADDGEGG